VRAPRFLHAAGNGKLVARDDRRAATLYAKSCELGDPQGCYNAGVMAEDGRGVRADPVKAAGCVRGGLHARQRDGVHEPGLPLRARARREGRQEARLRPLPARLRRVELPAVEPRGCVNVGRAYRDGIGVEKDEAKAAGVFSEACERPIDDDDPHSAESRARACSLQGALYLAGGGDREEPRARPRAHGARLRPRRLVRLLQRGDDLRQRHRRARGPAQAADYFEKACELGDGEGCADLADAYEKGEGVKRDRAKRGI
jgi:TPR repeat protein